MATRSDAPEVFRVPWLRDPLHGLLLAWPTTKPASLSLPQAPGSHALVAKLHRQYMTVHSFAYRLSYRNLKGKKSCKRILMLDGVVFHHPEFMRDLWPNGSRNTIKYWVPFLSNPFCKRRNLDMPSFNFAHAPSGWDCSESICKKEASLMTSLTTSNILPQMPFICIMLSCQSK